MQKEKMVRKLKKITYNRTFNSRLLVYKTKHAQLFCK